MPMDSKNQKLLYMIHENQIQVILLGNFITGIFSIIFNVILAIWISYLFLLNMTKRTYPILTSLLLIWTNISFSFSLLCKNQSTYWQKISTPNCLFFCFSKQIHFTLNTGLLLFLVLEQYIKICKSPSFYKKTMKKFNKLFVYSVIIFTSIIISSIQINWTQKSTKRKSNNSCQITLSLRNVSGPTLILLVEFIFLIVVFVLLYKIYKYLNKNRPSKNISKVESVTLYLFRSGHVVSKTSVEFFKISCTLLLCYIIFVTPINLCTAIFTTKKHLNKINRNFELVDGILMFFLNFYFLSLEIVINLFFRSLRQAEKSKIDESLRLKSTVTDLI